MLNQESFDKILDVLLPTLTPEEIAWLKQFRKGLWSDYVPNKIWRLKRAYCNTARSYLIQDIIDAKNKDKSRTGTKQIQNRKVPCYGYGEGLPQPYLLELAQLLNAPITIDDTTQWGCKESRNDLVEIVLSAV